MKNYFNGKITRAITNKGKEFPLFVGEVYVTNVGDIKVTNEGKEFVKFRTPIPEFAAKAMGEISGVMPETDSDGNAWATVTLWNSTPGKAGIANRFKKLVDNHPVTKVTISGKFRVSEREYNGNRYINIEINVDDTVDDFWGVQYRTPKKSEKKAEGSSIPKPTAVTTTAGHAESAEEQPLQESLEEMGFLEIDNDVDSDVPF